VLTEQNRALWDRLLINRGLAALDRAGRLGAAPGPYTLQAAIAACHARARSPEETDWTRIASLYADLAVAVPSPVVELNRAVAVAMSAGPQAGLNLVDRVAAEGALGTYYLLPAARGDLLARLYRFDEARLEFERAAALTRNSRERDVLLARAARCARDAKLPKTG
jgi:predicted RNA polymerase sigma factor